MGRGFGLLEVIFIGLIVLAMVVLVLGALWLGLRSRGRADDRTPSAPPAVLTPREILQARYARGEISREEYQQILADISGS